MRYSLLVLALAGQVLANDDALYQKHRRNFVQVDGAFIRLPKITKLSQLPREFKIGDAGNHYESRIVAVRGEADMLVRGRRKLDGKIYDMPLMRLIGYQTKGLQPGDLYHGDGTGGVMKSGIDVAICSINDGGVYLAVRWSVIEAGLTREQFAELLKSGAKLD